MRRQNWLIHMLSLSVRRIGRLRTRVEAWVPANPQQAARRLGMLVLLYDHERGIGPQHRREYFAKHAEPI